MDEQTKILICIDSTTIETFRNGLDPLLLLHTMISDYKPQTFGEVLAMANQEIKLDEDPAHIAASKGKSSGKIDTCRPKKVNDRFDPYKNHDPRPINSESTQASKSGVLSKMKKVVHEYNLPIEPNVLVTDCENPNNIKWCN